MYLCMCVIYLKALHAVRHRASRPLMYVGNLVHVQNWGHVWTSFFKEGMGQGKKDRGGDVVRSSSTVAAHEVLQHVVRNVINMWV